MKENLKVLLTNDDGINAAGLRQFALTLSEYFDVRVAAPDRERSATGHAITMHQPLRARPVELGGCSLAYAVDGTPADCVKLAVEVLFPEQFDLVVSGINRGANLGTDVLYSGTVSAALEGVLLGLPAIAVSLADYERADFRSCAKAAARLVFDICQRSWPAETLLNVNFPRNEPIRGLKVTTLGQLRYINPIQERQDPRGGTYYWLAGELSMDDFLEPTDVWAVHQGYVSLTPIHFDLTDYRVLKTVESWQLQLTSGGDNSERRE